MTLKGLAIYSAVLFATVFGLGSLAIDAAMGADLQVASYGAVAADWIH